MQHVTVTPSSTFDIDNIILPTTFPKKVQDVLGGSELGKFENRCAFIRECVNYFETRLPRPNAISKKICETYPVLKDANHTKFWVCDIMAVATAISFDQTLC